MSGVKISEKLLLNINEASEYSGIGTTNLRKLLKTPHCSFVLYNGNKIMVKRKQFEQWLDVQESIL